MLSLAGWQGLARLWINLAYTALLIAMKACEILECRYMVGEVCYGELYVYGMCVTENCVVCVTENGVI